MNSAKILDFGPIDTPQSPVPSHLAPHLAPKSAKRARHSQHTEKPVSTDIASIKDTVHELIGLILSGLPLKLSYQAYYAHIETLCRIKYLEQSKLADRIRSRIEDHFLHEVKPRIVALLSSTSLSTEECISAYLEVYHLYEEKLKFMLRLFLYLDRGYLLPHPTKTMILEQGLSLYVDELLVDNEYGKKTITSLVQLLEKEREGDSAEYSALAKGLAACLIKLNYNDNIHIKKDLVNEIICHYTKLKGHWLENDDYIYVVFAKMAREITYFQDAGHLREFLNELSTRLRWSLIFNDFNEVVERTLARLIEENTQELGLLYHFCQQSKDQFLLDSVAALIFHFGKLVYTQVESMLSSKPKNPIGSLLELIAKFRDVFMVHFKGNEKFDFELRTNLANILLEKRFNLLVLSSLSKYCDQFFKNRSQQKYAHFEAVFLSIFKALNNKMDFILVYKKDLSRRLLMNRSMDLQMEKRLGDAILELVGENSDEAVGLKVMFNDIEKSKYSYGHSGVDFEFSALVLDKKHWPEMPKRESEVIVPTILAQTLDKFTQQYLLEDDKRKGRKLDWNNYALHQVTMVSHFSGGSKELLVNLLQAVILMLFNQHETLTFAEIMDHTNMEEKLLRTMLSSLSAEKYQILLAADDSYSYNSLFTDKAEKIRIPVSRDREGGGNDSVFKKIEKNRNSEVRSALVRVIKGAQKMMYLELLSESIAILEARGPVTIQDLKANVEYLISNEFIERQADGQTLTYIP